MSTHSFSNKRNNPGRAARKERADERAANHVCTGSCKANRKKLAAIAVGITPEIVVATKSTPAKRRKAREAFAQEEA